MVPGLAGRKASVREVTKSRITSVGLGIEYGADFAGELLGGNIAKTMREMT